LPSPREYFNGLLGSGTVPGSIGDNPDEQQAGSVYQLIS
jgi:hypothetical protein